MASKAVKFDVRWALERFSHLPEGLTILSVVFDLVPLNYHYLINSGDYKDDLNGFLKQMDYITQCNLSDTLYESIMSVLGDEDEQQLLRSDAIFHQEYNNIMRCLQDMTWEFIQVMRVILPLKLHFAVQHVCASEFVRNDLTYFLTLEIEE